MRFTHTKSVVGSAPTVSTSVNQQKRAKPPKALRKENASLEQRIKILNWHYANGKVQTKTAKHFNDVYPGLNLSQPQISDWMKHEARWRAEHESSGGLSRSIKRVYQTQHPEVTEMLDLWVSKAMADKLLLTGEVLRQKWKVFADLAGVPDDERLSLSEGWLSRYKFRQGLKQIKRHGEAASTASETADKERLQLRELIKDRGYKPRDIFNADESALFYAYMILLLKIHNSRQVNSNSMPPDRGLSDKHNAGVKGKKTRLTYLVTTNADGSKKLAPLIIGKAYKPRAFKNKTGAQLGFNYRHNAKAWMTATLYQEWLLDWDSKLRREDRKILLLQDNFSGHVVPAALTNIHVENFEPNLTAHVQPNDQGIIRCFKAHYRAKFIQRAIDLYESGTTPSQIYEIDQLKAMRLADEAWHKVDTTVI